MDLGRWTLGRTQCTYLNGRKNKWVLYKGFVVRCWDYRLLVYLRSVVFSHHHSCGVMLRAFSSLVILFITFRGRCIQNWKFHVLSIKKLHLRGEIEISKQLSVALWCWGTNYWCYALCSGLRFHSRWIRWGMSSSCPLNYPVTGHKMVGLVKSSYKNNFGLLTLALHVSTNILFMTSYAMNNMFAKSWNTKRKFEIRHEQYVCKLWNKFAKSWSTKRKFFLTCFLCLERVEERPR